MENITEIDLQKITQYGNKDIDKTKHSELKKIYTKLEHIGKLLEKKGFEYSIRKDPRKQAGRGKFVFRAYQWLKIFPKGLKKYCNEKFGYIIGLSDTLHFHMMGIGNEYQHKPASTNASNQSWYKIDKSLFSFENLTNSFVEFDKKNRKLFIKTGAELGISKCIEIMNNQNILVIKEIIENKKQIIIQGAPGTGKTYISSEIALSIINDEVKNYSSRKYLMDDYKKAIKDGLINFTTFHQSMDYEEFIEGLRPTPENGNIAYEVEDGIFKRMCNKAKVKSENNFEGAYNQLIKQITEANNEILVIKTKTGKDFGISVNRNGNLNLHTGNKQTKQGTLTKDNILKQLSGINIFEGWESYFWGVINHLKEIHNFKENTSDKEKKYVLIIDEINRGNVSKIFGELITLLENDKRLNAENEIIVTLPYSKEEFGVPSNLYIIATMNTADRSVGHIDYAVRRRFAFITLQSEKEKIENFYSFNSLPIELSTQAVSLFDKVYKIMDKISLDFSKDDLMIGHSYFMAKSKDELQMKLDYEIKPLLIEYVKDGVLFMTPEEMKQITDLSI